MFGRNKHCGAGRRRRVVGEPEGYPKDASARQRGRVSHPAPECRKGTQHPLFESVRGAIGEMVVKQYGNKTVLTSRPVFRNRVFSDAQKASQGRFREAAICGPDS